MGLCALFIVSTVFHIVSWKKSHLRTVEHCFHMCDRMVIYFFIAASYAPWLNLRELGPLASHMRWFIWLMAAGGTIYVFLYHEKYKVVELFFYLTMGFSPALVVTSMNNTDGLHELACGGLIYCLGVVFFKSDGIIPFAHAIWHLFVATAAAVHYYAIWKYLYRSPTDFMRHLWPIFTRSSNQYYFDYGTWEWGKSWKLHREKEKKRRQLHWLSLYLLNIITVKV